MRLPGEIRRPPRHPLEGPDPEGPTPAASGKIPPDETRREFGEPFDFGDEITNRAGDSWEFAVGEDDHCYLCFLCQNRIEKYSPEGQLLWRADRELDNPTKLIQREDQRITPASASAIAPKFNRAAAGIAADDNGRAWVATFNRQIRDEEAVTIMTSGSPSGMTRKPVGETDLRTMDMFKLELFGPDGLPLGEIPLTRFVDLVHIHKDRLFLLDRDRGVKFCEDKIVEGERKGSEDVFDVKRRPVFPGRRVLPHDRSARIPAQRSKGTSRSGGSSRVPKEPG